MKNTGSMSTDSTIRSGERISLEKKFSVRFKKILAVCDAVLNCKNIKVSDNNLFINAGGSSTGSAIKGEWNPDTSYSTGDIVFFTPDGDFARTFYALQAVSGISPDTGSPNWASFPSSTPGVWG